MFGLPQLCSVELSLCSIARKVLHWPKNFTLLAPSARVKHKSKIPTLKYHYRHAKTANGEGNIADATAWKGLHCLDFIMQNRVEIYSARKSSSQKDLQNEKSISWCYRITRQNRRQKNMQVGTVKQISEHQCPATSFTLATTERESQGFLWNRNSRLFFFQ